MKTKSFSLRTKTTIFFGVFVFFIVGLFSTVQYYQLRNELYHSVDNVMKSKVNKLSETIKLQINDRQKTVNTSMNLAHCIFYNQGKLIESPDEKIEMNALNQITKAVHKVNVNKWTIKGEPIHNRFEIVDTIKKLSVETVTIFQKIDSGYLRISTNVMKLDSTRAVGTFIPNESEVIKTVERGETYRGRAYVVNDWYLTCYEPIYINNMIKGILYVGVKEKNFGDIEKLYLGDKFKSEKLLLVEKSKLKNTQDTILNLFNRYLETANTEEGNFEFTDNQNKEYTLYYFNNKLIDAYIMVSVKNSELYELLDGVIIISLIRALATAGLIMLVLAILITKFVFNPIEKVIKLLEQISNKRVGVKIEVKREDEIGKLFISINKISENFKELIKGVSKMTYSVSGTASDLNLLSKRMVSSASEETGFAENVSMIIEKMYSKINTNSEKAEYTGQISKETSNDIKQSKTAFDEAINYVLDIGKKAAIVEDIAFQTNILSLNAAMEAARAGKSGAGFTVVANEVRALAGKATNASQEIKELSINGRNASEEAGIQLENTIEKIQLSSDLVDNIVQNSREQRNDVGTISNTIISLSNIIQQNMKSSKEMSVSADVLIKQSTELESIISVFSIEN